MSRDIDQIIEQVQQRLPAVGVRQLQVTYPGVDDDGLWWFHWAGVVKDIQIESSNGMCPFIVEHSDMMSTSEAETAQSVGEAVEKIVSYLIRVQRT